MGRHLRRKKIVNINGHNCPLVTVYSINKELSNKWVKTQSCGLEQLQLSHRRVNAFTCHLDITSVLLYANEVAPGVFTGYAR